MRSSFKKLPGSMIDLEVVLDQKEFQEYWQAAHENALSGVHLKGFRPGTAPKDLASQAVDNDKVFQEAANSAIRHGLDELAVKNKWTIIDKPQVEVDEDKLGIKYKVKLTIFPEIKLGNYKKIAKKIFSEKIEVKVEPADVKKALDWLRESRKKGDQLPELNDQFAQELGKFKNLEELKESLVKGLVMEKEFREKDRQRVRVVEEIVKNSEIDTPEIMIEKTLDQTLSAEASAKADGQNEIRAKLREKTKNHVAANLVLYKIAEEEKLEYNPEQGVNNLKVIKHLESLWTNTNT